MTKGKSKQFSRICFVIGIMGTLIALLGNIFAIFVLDKPAATFFSSDWWSQWFPAYIVWPTFLILGFVFRAKANSSTGSNPA